MYIADGIIDGWDAVMVHSLTDIVELGDVLGFLGKIFFEKYEDQDEAHANYASDVLR